MINRLPAVAALALAATVVAACAETTSGTAAGPAAPLSNGPTAFPTQGVPSASVPVATVSPATPQQSTSSSTAPSTWSIATAGGKYLSYVARSNADGIKFDKLYDKKSVSVGTFTGLCTTLANDSQTFVQQLAEGNWPASVEPLIREFGSLVLEGKYFYLNCAKQKSVAAAKNVLQGFPDTHTAANKIRTALKLPPAK